MCELMEKRGSLSRRTRLREFMLQPGIHTITGRFSWPSLPENLQVPAGSALVSLTVNDEKIAFPDLDASGRLWLKRVQTEEKIENRLKIESFRLIDDSIPSHVLLYFTLDVAGSAREITIGSPLCPGKIHPTFIDKFATRQTRTRRQNARASAARTIQSKLKSAAQGPCTSSRFCS